MPSFEEIAKQCATPMKKKRNHLTETFDFPQPSLFIEHDMDGYVIPQRPRDGYINATLMCQKAGKRWGTYAQNDQTKAFLGALSADVGIPTSVLVQILKGGYDKRAQGTWVHPQVAVHLAQWLSPGFAVQVTKWVFDWMQGNVRGYMPLHVRRYIKNRAKVPHTHFSMLNEIYLNLMAPLEDSGYVLPNKLMPDVSTGRMFSGFLREKGIDPSAFPTYQHDFDDGHRPTVEARLYPIAYLPAFRHYFNNVWLPTQARRYFEERSPTALPHIKKIAALPSP